MALTANDFEPVIGLEVHAELATRSKMFCACPVVSSAAAPPNSAVCPVCAGMPGVLPVVNRRAVELGLQVALALQCRVLSKSIFARKNYFYPDMPKGYQISQYEQPLAVDGRLTIETPEGELPVRIRRVHLEEDAGKLTHVEQNGEAFSLVDLNRAGVPLLEIVTEPDLHSAEQVRIYAQTLRTLLRYLGVNSGDMEKGVLRIEPNISVRPRGSSEFGVRTEIKNLNSFRALERATRFEIERQVAAQLRGEAIIQETRGWDESRNVTYTQRTKEEADDYRYLPEPDLPPLLIDENWLKQIRSGLPETAPARRKRFCEQYGLNRYDAEILTAEPETADYFEAAAHALPEAEPKIIANWITGDLFSLLNSTSTPIDRSPVTPAELAELLRLLLHSEINQPTAKTVLAEMFAGAGSAEAIVAARGLRQVSDASQITDWVIRVLNDNPGEVESYLNGKETVAKWLFGQVMRLARGQANPRIIQEELDRRLAELREKN